MVVTDTPVLVAPWEVQTLSSSGHRQLIPIGMSACAPNNFGLIVAIYLDRCTQYTPIKIDKIIGNKVAAAMSV